MRRILFAGIAMGIFIWSVPATSRPFRPNQVPSNPFTQDECLLCHIGSGGGPRKAFGQDVETTLVGSPTSQADVDWQTVCPMDSDGDGYTNGEELGDPNCTWMVGDAQLSFDATDPSDASDPSCGNNVAAGPEVCDGTDLKNTTCMDLGAGTGTPTCNSTCSGFLTTTCTPRMDAGMDAGGTDTGSLDVGTDASSDVASMDIGMDSESMPDTTLDAAPDTDMKDVLDDTSTSDVDENPDVLGEDADDFPEDARDLPDADQDTDPAADGETSGESDSGCGCRSHPTGDVTLWGLLLFFAIFAAPLRLRQLTRR